MPADAQDEAEHGAKRISVFTGKMLDSLFFIA